MSMAHQFITPSPRSVRYILYLCMLQLIWKTCNSHLEVDKRLKSVRHAHILESKNTLENLKQSRTLSLVYYYHAADFPEKKSFLQAFDDSAKYLITYNVAVAVVNCLDDDLAADDKCKEEKVEKTVFTYQNGVEYIKLELDTMFDINSIMSNALQLLLLHEVPIIENQSDREALEASLIGQQDLIYFYTHAIGTQEHRVFMEVAHTYQDKYKFAVSTKMESNVGLRNSESLPSDTNFALWTLYCSKPSADDKNTDSCLNVLYPGSLTLSSLNQYVKQLSEPNLFYAPENGTQSLFELEGDLPGIFIFTINAMTKHSEEIANSLAQEYKGFAKVIVVNVDHKECFSLATDQGFDGHVPQLALSLPTKDKKFGFMKKQDRLILKDIRDFLVEPLAIKPSAGDDGEEFVDAADQTRVEKGNEYVSEVEIQDDEVAQDVYDKKDDKPEITFLPAVMKGTFDDVVGNAHLRMVLYYLPFDAVSLASLNNFEAAAKALSAVPTQQDVLVRVNCFDASDLCGRENITIYPVVRIHKKNMPYQPYEGPLDTDSLVKAVRLLQQEFPLRLENEDQMKNFLAGVFPSKFTDLSPSSVMFVAGREDKDAWSMFSAASKRLSTFVAMAEVQDTHLLDLIAEKYQTSVPCVVSIHLNDVIQPVKTSSNISNVDGVVSFVKQSMIPTMPELTVDNFPTLRAKNVPFVILFLDQLDPTSDDMRSAVTKISQMKSFMDSSFCWMNAQGETMGKQLLSEYTQKISLPTVAVVNHEQAAVFTHQPKVFNSNLIIQWLTNVFTGKEGASKKLEEREWTPGPYFDFLTLMDNEQKGENQNVEEPAGDETDGHKDDTLNTDENFKQDGDEEYADLMFDDKDDIESELLEEDFTLDDAKNNHDEL